MEEVIGGWIREGVPSAETERVSKIPRGEIVVFGINQGGNKLYSLIADFFEIHSSLWKLWKLWILIYNIINRKRRKDLF